MEDEFLIQTTCECCGKKFKTINLFDTICNECLKELSDLICIEYLDTYTKEEEDF